MVRDYATVPPSHLPERPEHHGRAAGRRNPLPLMPSSSIVATSRALVPRRSPLRGEESLARCCRSRGPSRLCCERCRQYWLGPGASASPRPPTSSPSRPSIVSVARIPTIRRPGRCRPGGPSVSRCGPGWPIGRRLRRGRVRRRPRRGLKQLLDGSNEVLVSRDGLRRAARCRWTGNDRKRCPRAIERRRGPHLRGRFPHHVLNGYRGHGVKTACSATGFCPASWRLVIWSVTMVLPHIVPRQLTARPAARRLIVETELEHLYAVETSALCRCPRAHAD